MLASFLLFVVDCSMLEIESFILVQFSVQFHQSWASGSALFFLANSNLVSSFPPASFLLGTL